MTTVIVSCIQWKSGLPDFILWSKKDTTLKSQDVVSEIEIAFQDRGRHPNWGQKRANFEIMPV